MTLIVGLTGSIAMGKTTAATMLSRLGLRVCDSDNLVHDLLKAGGAAVPVIKKEFDGVVIDGAVDRTALGQKVFGDASALASLEQILHPLVREAQELFIKRCQACKSPIIALDVPLLFEVKTDRICDYTLVVSAPGFVQRQRAMARPGMTLQRFKATLDRQMPDNEKRKKADFVVCTGLGKRHTFNQLFRIVRRIKN
ncbi:MAG: dephospho-CoA kinase [Rhodospirillales bacterium]|nr:dephospho-CoA kinase [Rhodospirillales bacterium]|tara:strand:+ start:7227 stop:7817 length:591 start_codon:yes stop_codon:yes gene_type:complete